MEPTYSIGEMSEMTGLSYDTIRYYEKMNLIPPAKRNKYGQREYSRSDYDRLVFVTRLKRTQMPLKEIERYMAAVASRDYEACYHALIEHKNLLAEQQAEINATLELMNFKMEYFHTLMTDTKGASEPKGELHQKLKERLEESRLNRQ
ncbi:MerR family transcriptional regulator [Paenibacillus physcomitrellae]|uniref:MerR family transcriptional regulator n=1 Tax=Paenibacillus physcomitrellae TaxID=1619311 RepID=A0ABQ1FT48_9BACL|nr:MerR family transcriptional regulator [Paenibacillus physcomitrellae]GGA29505.1 MerR family transcriptional regulator [Paenibacillus physcomitrellae]